MTPEEIQRLNRNRKTFHSARQKQSKHFGRTAATVAKAAVVIAAVYFGTSYAIQYFSDKSLCEQEAKAAAQQREMATELKERQEGLAFQKRAAQFEANVMAESIREKRQNQADWLEAQKKSLAEERQRLAEERQRLAAERNQATTTRTPPPSAPADNSDLALALEKQRRLNEMVHKVNPNAAPRDAMVSANDISRGGALALAQAKLPRGATVNDRNLVLTLRGPGRIAFLLYICHDSRPFRAGCKCYFPIFWVSLRSPSASWRTEAARSMAGAQKWLCGAAPGRTPSAGRRWPCFTGHGGQAQSVSTFS